MKTVRPKLNAKQAGTGKNTPALQGAGIDIISLARVKQLFKHHTRDSMKGILSEAETELYHKEFSPRDFARHFAAKEAFFKSMGAAWMGPDGLRRITIKNKKNSSFEAETQGFFSPERMTAQGNYFEAGNWVGAEVIRFDGSKI